MTGSMMAVREAHLTCRPCSMVKRVTSSGTSWVGALSFPAISHETGALSASLSLVMDEASGIGSATLTVRLIGSWEQLTLWQDGSGR